MTTNDPIDLLFGGMKKLSPGSDAHTLHVLGQLPKRERHLIVDAGCGTGRQTLVLARELGTTVHVVDSYEAFLSKLGEYAREARLDHLVRTHCMDMEDLPNVFHDIDLLWSEGAAYNIGFENALNTWLPAIRRGGLAVVSELCWLREQVPDRVRDFFRTGYPDMHSVEDNVAVAERAGYDVLATHTLPGEAWVEDYYDILQPRAEALSNHPDSAVREFAIETIKEIETFEHADGSYGYVFYVLQRA